MVYKAIDANGEVDKEDTWSQKAHTTHVLSP
jgi:hypothetical protein